jgi:hypothetical protein
MMERIAETSPRFKAGIAGVFYLMNFLALGAGWWIYSWRQNGQFRARHASFPGRHSHRRRIASAYSENPSPRTVRHHWHVAAPYLIGLLSSPAALSFRKGSRCIECLAKITA